MSGLSRIATFKKDKNTAAIVLVCDGEKLEIKQTELSTVDTSLKVESALTTAATAAKVKLPPMFIHKNRDGSYAIATGQEPRIWPEDEKQ
jgi:hypothetical protein